MEHLINNQEFENIIRRGNKAEMFEAFYTLAERVVKFGGKLITSLPDQKIITSCVEVCFEKLHRFNPDKTKAKSFNFFTTIILCHYRQLYRINKNYEELKKNYILKNSHVVE